MMVVWALVHKDLQRLRNDRKALLVNLVLPLLLTLIMGVSFGGIGGQGGMSTIPLVVVADGLPTLVRESIERALSEGGFFSLTWADSLAADAAVRSGEVAAAVVFPPDLFATILNGEDATIGLWKDPGSPLKAGIIEEILHRGLARYQAGDAAYRTLWPEDVSPIAADSASGTSLADLFSGDFGDIWQRFRSQNVDWQAPRDVAGTLMLAIDHQVILFRALDAPDVSLSALVPTEVEAEAQSGVRNLFNYFLPSFAVFFLMFAVAASARDIHRERTHLTLRRQLISPVRGWEFVFGKWLAAVVQGMIQLGVLFGVGAVVFRINLGPDVWSLPGIMFATSAAAAGVFILLALLTPNEHVMDNLSTVVVLVSAMIGGNFMPIDAMPLWLRNLGQAVFNYWANLGFTNVVANNHSLAETPRPIIILSGFALVMLLANLVAFADRSRRGGLA